MLTVIHLGNVFPPLFWITIVLVYIGLFILITFIRTYMIFCYIYFDIINLFSIHLTFRC